MLFTSHPYAQASGSIGGTVYSRNRGGMYVRHRAIPTDPATTRQLFLRNSMSALASMWNDVLTSDARAGWNLYGSNVAMTNRLGETIYLSGQQHFLRSNLPRLQTDGILNIVTDPPTVFNLGDFTLPEIDSANTDSEIDISFDNDDPWANVVSAGMLAYGGRPQNAGIGFFRGPYRYMGLVQGATPTPPASPETFNSEYVLTAAQNVWAYVRFSQADGRLSQRIELGPVIVAPVV